MKYLSVKVDKPIDEVKLAIHNYLSTVYGGVEIINNKILCEVPEKRFTSTKKHYFIAIYLKTHQDSTALFFVSLTEENYDFERDFKKILQNVEYQLKVYSHFSNLTIDYFIEKEEKSEEKHEVHAIPSLKRFDEIIEKLISLKNLLDQKIITELEYKEKSEPLIEEL